MSQETAKANIRRLHDPLFRKAVRGHGVDIGPGNDPLNPKVFPEILSLTTFDQINGNAQTIHEYFPPASFDFVYSSNCLEHMENPTIALHNWLALVKPQGWLIITVPDEDLYEQGYFPSVFNQDHKWTFTIAKHHSWSKNSINVAALLSSETTPALRIHRIALQDNLYDYDLPSGKTIDQTYPVNGAEAFIEIIAQKLPQPV
jgi:SAM-dependent methyltransferase